jgi:hypothetical protein
MLPIVSRLSYVSLSNYSNYYLNNMRSLYSALSSLSWFVISFSWLRRALWLLESISSFLILSSAAWNCVLSLARSNCSCDCFLSLFSSTSLFYCINLNKSLLSLLIIDLNVWSWFWSESLVWLINWSFASSLLCVSWTCGWVALFSWLSWVVLQGYILVSSLVMVPCLGTILWSFFLLLFTSVERRWWNQGEAYYCRDIQMKSGSTKYLCATSNREMKPSIASRHPQEHGSVQQSHVGLLLGLTGQRNGAREKERHWVAREWDT